MSNFKSRYIFASTSPRNPKLIQSVLKTIKDSNLEAKIYNEDVQRKFYYSWANSNAGVKGAKNSKDAALSGRDKLTRAPQALGFLKTQSGKPLTISDAGNLLMKDDLFEDVLLHQMLKFQLPSPLHHELEENKGRFCIKPYLEIIRLIHKLKYLTYQELLIFGMSLTDYHEFNKKVKEIKEYRKKRKEVKNHISLKRFDSQVKIKVYTTIYSDVLKKRNFKTRESTTNSAKSFMHKKLSNLNDYTDAVFRMLRSSGLLVLTKGKSMSISQERESEVEFLLKNVQREPLSENMNRDDFDKYMYDPKIPVLLLDNKNSLEKKLRRKNIVFDDKKDDIYSLKSKLLSARFNQRKERVNSQVNRLKKRNASDIKDILNTYDLIKKGEIIDAPAMMEWNTWRALTMIDDGKIKYNFSPDDNGLPLSTASGNKADIEGEYDKFNLLVEVTLSTGKRQYDTEGEPVTRHVGEKQIKSKKPTFGLFIANKLQDNVIYHFFLTSMLNSSVYNGKVNIIPMDIDNFISFFKHAINKKISSKDLYKIYEYSESTCNYVSKAEESEMDWQKKVIKYMLNI